MTTKQIRSEQTKQRILTAARLRFSAEGYERTTIRSVAGDAEIDPSMVMRYFGSKEGLFAAAATFDLHLPDLASLPRKERGARLAEHLLDVWGHSETGQSLVILVRTAATNEGAAARVRQIFREQVLATVAKVAPDAASVRASLISSHILGLAYCRYVVEIPEVAAMSEQLIAANLGRTLQEYLDRPVLGVKARQRTNRKV
jgi:AcrR family transcriptional regulator